MSKNKIQTDPYVYPHTSTLRNKFGLEDQQQLQEVEGVIFSLKALEPLPKGNFDYDHLKAIHHHFFGDIYEWAGQQRTIDIAKGNSYFGNQQYLTKELNKLFNKLKADNYLRELPQSDFCKKLSFYFNEINAAHPFREGNGRTQRAFCDALANQAGYKLDWMKVNKEEYLAASISGFLHADYEPMEIILKAITIPLQQTQKINFDSLDEHLKTLCMLYVKKQTEMTELAKQKYTSTAKGTSHKLLMLNNEIKKIETQICNNSIVKELNYPHSTSLQKAGGFAEINTRIQNNNATNEDFIAVLAYAKTQVAASKVLNRKITR